jgi:peptide chain release factor subunit 1
MAASTEEMEWEISRLRMKQTIKRLNQCKGNGTSLITVMLTPKDHLNLMVSRLTQEHGTAASIKSHTTKLAVLAALTSVIGKLKTYNRLPPNGLVVYSGNVSTDENSEKKLTIDFEPFKPVPRSMYYCDNKFHTEPLEEMLQSDDKYGFIIVDGKESLFGVVCGNTREVLYRSTVDLPKKHRCGGQSALRFSRLRIEARHNYLHKVAELGVRFFITNDRPNVKGLVIAGSADFKNDLAQSQMFDQRLRSIIMKVVDVGYGGEIGFNQAVDMAADCLSKVRVVAEKRLLEKYFEDISKDTNQVVYGLHDTVKALEMGAVERLVLWEDFDGVRLTSKRTNTGEEMSKFVSLKESTDREYYVDKETGATLEVTIVPMLDYITENYKKYGCTLEIVSDKTSEGTQFVRGFGGIGGFLRYQVDFVQLKEADKEYHADNSADKHKAEAPTLTAEDDFDFDDFM